MAQKRRKTKKDPWQYGVIAIAVVVAAVCLLSLLLLETEEAPPPTEIPTIPTTEPPPTVPQSIFHLSDFAENEGFLSCIATDSMIGIDVSHHQGDIDWQKVKESGITFVMVRLGYRGIGDGILYTDRYAEENLTGAREAGLMVGAYFYSQATTAAEAREEAAYALKILGDFRLDLPLSLDWEIARRTENVDGDTATELTQAFCEMVRVAGYEPMIYFNSDQATNLLDMNRLTQYIWWLAMYTHKENFPCHFDVWQYTDSGRVPGISGKVDLNVWILS